MTFPCYFLPPVSYMREALKKNSLCIEVHEHFPKQTNRNRFNIYGANGLLPLSIPLESRRNKTITKDIRISYAVNWQRQHWRSIESAYRSSAFFEHYEHHFLPIFQSKHTFLIDLNIAALQTLFKIFKSSKEIIPTTEYKGSILEFQGESTTYHQVFKDKHGFIPDLSVIDLIFNSGPMALNHLQD